jgi:glycosyltransferase involved in cell wall biosynthesis
MIFLIFGTLPPPVGGVTSSNLNLVNSLKSLNISSRIFSIKMIFSFKRFDIGHIHYYKRWKVFIAIMLSKLLCKKTIYTSHGAEFYPQKELDARLILYLVNGMITLNQEVYNRCIKVKKKNVIKLPTLYAEGVSSPTDKKELLLLRKKNYKYILMYASNKRYKDKIEVYGCKFILNLIDKFLPNQILVFVDPSGEYREDISKISDKIIYIDRVVDFNSLLQEVDIYIRPTNFDGNSVATLEALSLGVPVLASNILERNLSVVTYIANDKDNFLNKLESILDDKHKDNKFSLESITLYINFCLEVLKIKDKSKK